MDRVLFIGGSVWQLPPLMYAKKRNLRNKSIKTELKTVLKSLDDSSVENKSNALKTLDIAYSKGIITKNFRDRNKSKI